MAKKTINDFLILDLREEGSEKLLRKALTKTSWLERFESEELTIDILEICYRKVVAKYKGGISYVMNASHNSWAFSLRNDKTGAWITTVYVLSLYEGMAKSLLALYGYYIKGMKFHDEKGDK